MCEGEDAGRTAPVRLGLGGDGPMVPAEQPCSARQDWRILRKDVLLLVPIRHCSCFHTAHSIRAELLMALLYLVDVFSPGCKVKPIKSLHSGTTARLTTPL